jgi:GNAT superfamily N-acetyltransferase
MRFVVCEAQGEEQVRRCRELAAQVHDLSAEPAEGWPDRWLMGAADGQLVATIGLSRREGCVRWFLGEHAFSLAQALTEAGARELVELRLLAVAPSLRGYRFARLLMAVAYSRGFLAPSGEVPAVIQFGPPAVFKALERLFRVQTQLVGRCSDGELRVLVPDRDVPRPILEQPLPAELGAEAFRRPGRSRAAMPN